MEREDQVIGKVMWRLLPLLILLYLAAYIDRQNVSYAKLQMLGDLHISEISYGFGSSLFFIGYLLFGLPSNRALHKFGARKWVAFLVFAWGLVTLALAWSNSTSMFYVLRFLLGAAEAGLYPGLLFYMTLWFPSRHRVRAVGYFTLASSLGNMTGAMLGGYLLSLDGLAGLRGWQLLFVATGIPPILLAAATMLFLPESPRQAGFLSPEERETVLNSLATEKPKDPESEKFWKVLAQPRTFILAFFYMLISLSSYGISYWLPTVVKAFGVTSTVNGALNMIPWFLTTLALLLIPRRLKSFDAIMRCILIVVPFGVVCFVLSATLSSPALRLTALSFGAPCIFLLIPCFWWVPARLLHGAQAAAGIAAINALGNMGGFFGQNLMPLVLDRTHSVNAPMAVPAVCLATFGLGALWARRLLKNKTDAAANG